MQHMLIQLPKHNIPINHEAQQVGREDFRTFDYILGSDANNVRDLERLKPKDAKATVALWGSFDDGRPIADPYYGGIVSSPIPKL